MFARIFELLIDDGMLGNGGRCVHMPPYLPPPAVMHLAHCPAYLDAFCNGALDPARVREIGFGDTTRQPVLVERTLAEVAGVHRKTPPQKHRHKDSATQRLRNTNYLVMAAPHSTVPQALH